MLKLILVFAAAFACTACGDFDPADFVNPMTAYKPDTIRKAFTPPQERESCRAGDQIIADGGSYHQTCTEVCTCHDGRFSCRETELSVCSQVIDPEAADHDDRLAGEVTVTIAATLVDCVGVGPMQCMTVETSSNAGLVQAGLFYDIIEGFTFVPGVRRVLELKVYDRAPPFLPDSSSRRYELVREASLPTDAATRALGTEGGK